jgi:hypothetical protein
MLVVLRVGEQRYRAVWEVLDGASVTEVARRFTGDLGPRRHARSARSLTPGRGASGRGMPFFVLADALEGETRPRDEVSYGLRDEDLRRAGQDSCRGTPSKGEERGRTRLERVLAPGVRSGPC